MNVSVLDCTGCGNCAEVCPAPTKALVMKPAATQEKEQANYDYAQTLSVKENPMNKYTVKGSQFEKPLLEFHGACGGCGEAAYAKLIIQLFGDRMMIANATGCTLIWGGSVAATPYTKNHEGKGPAWANSLFEDNAEYGLGMSLGVSTIRTNMENVAKEAMENVSAELKDALQEWIDNKEDAEGSKKATAKLLPLLEAEKANSKVAEILENKDFLIKRSQWIFGRSEEHTSELQSRQYLVCRLLLEKKKNIA